MKIFYLLIFCHFIFVLSITSFAQILPPERFKVLENIGLENQRPTYYDSIIDVCQPPYNLTPDPNGDLQTNSNKINQIINDLRNVSGWKCIYFSQAGTYRFGNSISLTVADTNLVFKGISSSQVILHFKIGNQASHMFNIIGSAGQPTAITETLYKGTNSINNGFPNGLAEGDWVEIYNDWSTNMNLGSWTKIGQITKIESLANKTLRDDFTITYSNTYSNKIKKIEPIYNIGFEDFTIRRDGADGYSTDGSSSNFNFEYAVNCWIYGVESWGTRGWHVGIGKSSNIYIHGNFFHHANDYGGGCGYGVSIFSRSSNCLVENNIFNYLRHSMLVQASANRNIFTYNYSYDCESDYNADISIHGTYPNTNLFEENFVEYIYADYTTGSDGKYENGPYNTIFRNEVVRNGNYSNILINAASYANVLGNQCNYLNYDSRSNFMFEAYGYTTPEPLTGYSHNFVRDNRYLESSLYIKDYSYFYTQRPAWLPGNYTWPTIGPRINSSALYSTNSIPARDRKLAGGKYTLNGLPVMVKVKLNPGFYPETNTNGGTYKINGFSLTQYLLLYNTPVIIQAFPQNSEEVFYKWADGSTSNPRTIQIKNSLNINAFFKYPNKSSNANGYDKDGQKKIARGPDGGLWKVYESAGCIWIEKDGQVRNNGLAINEFSDGPEAKSPSMDYFITSSYATEIFVVYQQKTTNGKFKIKLAKFNESGQKIYTYDALTSTNDYATFDVTPIVAVSHYQGLAYGKPKFCIVWRQQTEGSFQNGLYYLPGVDNGTTVTWYYFPPQKFTSTDSQSANPTIAVFKSPGGSGAFLYHVAWQQGTSKIKYRALLDNWNGSASGGVTEIGNLEEPSSGSGSSINYEPSIALINTGTGSNYGLYSFDSPKLVWKGDYSVIHRSRTNSTSTGTWNTFYNYYANDDISAANINSALEEQSYVIVWAELQGYYNRYIKSTNLSTQILMSGIRGKDLQVSNYTALWDGVTINVFNNDYYHSSPFSFQLFNFYEGFSKQGNLISKEGRFGTVMKNEAEFYFGMGDITLDNNLINFKPSIDTLEIISNESLNSYLVSEPFQVNDNSSLTYTVFYGVKDSMEALSNLSNSESVSFKIELIDNSTNEVLGVFDEITQNNQNLVAYENISYQINTSGIGNRTVRLRLTVNENLSVANYSLSKIYSDGGSLSKSKIKEVSWNGSLTVKEYSLEQNYPNPFNPRTNIKFQLPKSGFVTLKVYDILGKEITTLINEDKAQGQYEVNFDASSLASGVYIYKINAGDFNSTKKMILVK